jgi:4-hydroxyproline epimerase
MAAIPDLVGELGRSDRMSVTTRIRIIDTHTEGEPTRVVIDGGPDLGMGPLRERLSRFRQTADDFRRTVILEPRGSDILVGALLCEPDDPSCETGVIFFNNAGYLGMCGHGMMGVAAALNHIERIQPGVSRIETPVGAVEVNLCDSNHVEVENVPSFRYRSKVRVNVETLGPVIGDIAWGGNWFFQVDEPPFPLHPDNIRPLSDAAALIRQALRCQGITGVDGAEIDHIEFFGGAVTRTSHSRNFVYCPGGAYDRSPCGTGTSAKVACLAADGILQPGEVWVQESIIGSRFAAKYRKDAEGRTVPTIIGRAYICSEATLIQQPGDPFANGIDTGGPVR